MPPKRKDPIMHCELEKLISLADGLNGKEKVLLVTLDAIGSLRFTGTSNIIQCATADLHCMKVLVEAFQLVKEKDPDDPPRPASGELGESEVTTEVEVQRETTLDIDVDSDLLACKTEMVEQLGMTSGIYGELPPCNNEPKEDSAFPTDIEVGVRPYGNVDARLESAEGDACSKNEGLLDDATGYVNDTCGGHSLTTWETNVQQIITAPLPLVPSHRLRCQPTHAKRQPHSCRRCRKKFTRLTTLKKHEKTHTAKEHHRCTYCGKAFPCVSKLRQHEMTHTGEKPHCCTDCNKRFSTPANLKRHKTTHTGEKPHCCTDCNKRFSCSTYLKQHKITHTGEGPHRCTDCNKRFSCSTYLKRHKITHAGEKPHCCTDCNKRFSCSAYLKRHKRTHAGEKPHCCTDCNKRFSCSTYLKRHKITHTGERPHRCTDCNKRFSTPANLKRHKIIHTGEKPHHCTDCNRSFNRFDTLQKHELKHTAALQKRSSRRAKPCMN